MQNNTVETLIAALVVAVAAGFFFFAYKSTHSANFNGYDITASFNSVDGIQTGADVRLHGIKIGSVTSIALDEKTYKPIVHLLIRDDIRIPTDSGANVGSSLLNGNPYLAIQPGRSATMVVSGETWKPH
jgi:phospholipid/cholesterol/gamma-HCH transport system substrate-binding protein